MHPAETRPPRERPSGRGTFDIGHRHQPIERHRVDVGGRRQEDSIDTGSGNLLDQPEY
ncbi:hypothetical protein [Nocardia farcinica]|uniref:hypothetical protein n=1 Tax=Nocardia farcinica TaxID=37329 RepID=UPI001895AF15|nr:hypothetical protein [Nocardia farcinica]MBF6071315.1 hypothetical protein [Nocardia farcinica]